jgi:endonuclease-3 related protein
LPVLDAKRSAPAARSRAAGRDWRRPYEHLLAHYGRQHWWPGDTPFEIMVGAVLTQNTAWTNVEQAIARLKAAEALSAAAILALPEPALAELIRPAGYFNVKTRRLKALCAFLAAEGVADAPARLAGSAPLPALRARLLAVHGVGEETADSILLYALDLPSFVVDAYTRRIFGRLGLLHGDETYAAIQAQFSRHLAQETPLYNEYHALIVHLGKQVCRPLPRCGECPLARFCPRQGLAG